MDIEIESSTAEDFALLLRIIDGYQHVPGNSKTLTPIQWTLKEMMNAMLICFGLS